MATITVLTNLTLDGVYQGPGRPDEDPRGDFAHGGWATAYQAMSEAGSLVGDPGELLFGRWTYELFFASWAPLKGNPFSEFFNARTKHVVTRNPSYGAKWENSQVVSGGLEAVVELKRTLTKDLLVFGSGQLVAGLMGQGLVDRWVLLIHPLVLGSGRSIGAAVESPVTFGLEGVKSTSKGVLVATYTKGSSLVAG